jgi:hypothetical protein
MTEEKTIDKIRKLLKFANDERGNQTERDTALRQAYKLLSKHNLTLPDVAEGGDEELRVRESVELSVYPWARIITNSLARLFFCAHYFQRSHKGKNATHYFVGKQANAITASEMSAYVVKSVFKELRARFGSDTSPEARSFAMGVADTIVHRVAELRSQAEQEQADEQAQEAAAMALQGDALDEAVGGPTGTGTALVLANVYASEAKANDAWIAENVGGLQYGADRTKAVGGSAYRAGRKHGEGISLQGQLGSAKAKSIK